MRGLARSRPVLRHASLTACMTLALRPPVASQFSAKDVSALLVNVLSVPGLVSHLQSTASEVGTRRGERGEVGVDVVWRDLDVSLIVWCSVNYTDNVCDGRRLCLDGLH